MLLVVVPRVYEDFLRAEDACLRMKKTYRELVSIAQPNERLPLENNGKKNKKWEIIATLKR